MPAATPARRRVPSALLAAVALMVLTACGSTAPGPAPSVGGAGSSASQGPRATGSATTATSSAPDDPTSPERLAPAAPTTGLRTMTVAQLPPEGVETLRLIAAGGPFPYSKDGATFGNREGVLPKHASGWYHEYTVITPGEGDRGARRIVTGDDGSRFYTSDHYASFREVISGEKS